MTTKEKARICELVISDQFGESVAKVASTLLHRGRLSLPTIMRFSGLRRTIIQASIIILVQHNCLWHTRIDEGERMVEYFEINADEILHRQRFGRYVMAAKEKYGVEAGEIVEVVLLNGKLRIADVVEQIAGVDAKRSSVLQTTFQRLVAKSYLLPSLVSAHISPRDKLIAWEKEERLKIKGVVTPKELKEIRIKVEVRLREEMEEEKKRGGGLRKRKAAAALNGHASKKSRTSSKSAKVIVASATGGDDDGDNDMEVDPAVYFRVNYERFELAFRNDLIVKAATSRYNATVGTIVKGMLDMNEDKQKSLADVRSDPISVNILWNRLEKLSKFNITKGMNKESFPSKSRPTGSSLLSEYMQILSCDDDISSQGRRNAFIARTTAAGGGSTSGRAGGSSFTIEFEEICRRFKMRVLRSVVEDKFGTHAVRIMSILLDKGKLNEGQIAKIAMLAPKDARAVISVLSTSSLIELQEVPKSADRAPSRTLYYWYVDLSKVRAWLLDHLYKTLCNIYERRRVEVEKQSTLVVKAERTDVQNDMEKLLTSRDREALAKLNETIRTLRLAEQRVEQDIFVLKDLPG